MKDKVFLDANVLLYALSATEPDKAVIARRLLLEKPTVSPQVLFESLHVMLRKWRLPRAAAVKAIKGFLQNCEVCIEDETVVRQAIQLFERFHFQSYDAKIVAAALRADCTVLYSEDFQPGLVVNDSLTILNPFLTLPEA